MHLYIPIHTQYEVFTPEGRPNFKGTSRDAYCPSWTKDQIHLCLDGCSCYVVRTGFGQAGFWVGRHKIEIFAPLFSLLTQVFSYPFPPTAHAKMDKQGGKNGEHEGVDSSTGR
jgi:hypothetical protein